MLDDLFLQILGILDTSATQQQKEKVQYFLCRFIMDYTYDYQMQNEVQNFLNNI